MSPPAPHPHAAAVRSYRPLVELIPQHWQSHQIAADDGADLHVTETGNCAPPLLLVHGLQVNGLSWLRTAQALEADHRLILPDLRGHGRSARVGGVSLSADRLLADLRAVLAHFSIEPRQCHLVGHSLGADLAGRLAAALPFASCTLVEPALQDFATTLLSSDGETPSWLASLYDTLAALADLPHAEQMQRALALLPPGAPLYEERDYVAFVAGQAQFDPAFFAQIAQLGYLFQEPTVIADIACPLLLMTARPMMPGACLEPDLSAFTGHWQRGEHRHFPHCGHAIQFEALAEFVAELRRFWERVSEV